MELDAQRRAENFAITCPLKDIEDPDVLAFVASLIQDHDHMREKLLTEPDPQKRTEKLEAMRPHLRFKADTADNYFLAEQARRCGVQPIYAEANSVESMVKAPSFIREVQG